MNKVNDKVTCETPTPGKKPTRIDRWKYEAVSQAILEVLPSAGEGVPFKSLSSLVSEKLDAETKRTIGSLSWYTTTVKLDLECKNKIRRIPDVSPQRLLKGK